VQDVVGSLGQVTGVTRRKQVRPHIRHFLQGARGNLASAVALAGKAGLGNSHGKTVIKRWLMEELESQRFLEMVEARSAKFATMG